MDKTYFVIFSLIQLTGFTLVIYGFACFLFSLRHRLPDIPWGWVLKTRFGRANFTPRGQTLRRRWTVCGLMGLAMFLGGGIVVSQFKPPVKPPAASQDF